MRACVRVIRRHAEPQLGAGGSAMHRALPLLPDDRSREWLSHPWTIGIVVHFLLVSHSSLLAAWCIIPLFVTCQGRHANSCTWASRAYV
jgi:hypothetical protein